MSSTNAYTGPTFDLYFTHGDGIFSLTVPDVSEDVWRCVEEYDRLYGTDFFDRLCTADILPLDGTRYCAVPVGIWADVLSWRVC